MKPYQRGKFRAIKWQPKPEEFPKFWSYAVQVAPYGALQGGIYSDWVTIESSDYASSARLRVRNLHAACCIHADLTKPKQGPAALHELKAKAKYFKAPR